MQGTLDTTDGHMGVNHAPENLDRQCEKMKVRCQLVLILGKSPPCAQHHNLFSSKSSEHCSLFVFFNGSVTLRLLAVPFEVLSPLVSNTA